jgi:hypothetical protein
MHAAPLTSPRLQRVLMLLSDGKPRSTREIVRRARVMAVNACVAELRAHGAEITCTASIIEGQRRFFYRMTKEPDTK